MTDLSLALIPALPLAMAAGLSIPFLRQWLISVLPLAALPAVVAALTFAGDRALDLPWLTLGARLELNAMSAAFLAFTGLVWLLAGWAAVLQTAAEPRRLRFAVLFLMAMAGNLGLLVSADMFGFFAFFAMMSLASYGLVVHAGGPLPAFAGRAYISFVILGELALFGGLAIGAFATGGTLLADLGAAPLPLAATLLLTLGFAIKLGIVPLHLWLPLAHSAAPAPASAVLSGAMLKAGLFGLLSVLPLGNAALPGLGAAMIACGVVSVVLSLAVGVTQKDAKSALAYSSVGQMGLAAIALGAGLIAPAAWPMLLPALMLLAAHHAFAKSALFLGVPALQAARRPAHRSAIVAGLALPALALAAAPFTAGALAKEALKAGLEAAATGWATLVGPMLIFSSLATALLTIRALSLLALAGSPAQPRPAGLVAPWAAAVALALWGTGFVPLPAAGGSPGLGDSLTPIAAALATALIVTLALRLARIEVGAVPAGEVLALFAFRPAAPAAPPPLALPHPDLRPRGRRTLARRAWQRPEPAYRTGGVAVLGVLSAMIVLGIFALTAPSAPVEPTVPPASASDL